ncbi:SDR family oxidoreductase, partial [archaeon]|nr:SDR family oxidoreductase [archaeon]
MKDLNKKTILITGAASGIGKALSLEFAKLGSSLVLLDINKEGLKKLKNKIENQYETNVKAIKCDLTNKKNIQKIPNDILKEIDILINNAGAGAKGFFNDRTYDEFEFIANINYLSVVQLTHKFLKTTDFNKMKYIINISSPAGFLDVPYMSAYSSSKKAITSFTKCLQIELYDKNLKI